MFYIRFDRKEEHVLYLDRCIALVEGGLPDYSKMPENLFLLAGHRRARMSATEVILRKSQEKRGRFAMKCPYCSQENTRVIDSRPAEDNSSIRRRRLCDSCGKRFTTYEKIETIPIIVIKKDNNREPYDRSKIEDGILRACHKRPVPLKDINGVIDAIESEIFNREEREIASSVIGEMVMDKLKDLDSVAYVRFASVYREFKDVNTFLSELKKMLDK